MDLDLLIENIDIVEFISQYVLLEEKNGEWWGLSPFKSEKTPSFSVRRENSSFYDFSSGIGGNVFTFAKRYFRCDSKKAIDILSEYANGVGDFSHTVSRLTASSVCKRYGNNKVSNHKCNATVLQDDFMLRYEDEPDKLAIWEREGISKEVLREFEVKYDKFSNRIVYPIRNSDGKIVNIGGRTLNPDFKELGLKKYCYFYSWGDGLNVIYGISDKRVLKNSENASKNIIIFEGCKSVLIANTWGIKNSGAILTSHLNTNQMKMLAAIGLPVVFALDKDVDVRKDRNIQRLKKFTKVEYIQDRWGYLDEKDSPVDKGIDVFNKLYERRFSWN